MAAFGEVPPKAEKPAVTMYFVYILQSLSKKRFYIGHSSNVERRLKEHNAGKVRSTKGYVPWQLIYEEEHKSKSQAFAGEMQIKKYKSGEAFKKLIGEI